MFKEVDWNELLIAFKETFFLSISATVFVFVLGLFLGIVLFISKPQGLNPNKYVFRVLNLIVNTFRSIPFIILIILILPLTKILVGSIIGTQAFLPGLVIAASPFYARMVENSLNEIDGGIIEAAQAMGANTFTIIRKFLIPEALPSLINGITITCISIIGYSTMAGIIGGGGLGELARRYGYIKNNLTITLLATLSALVLVLVVQGIGDYLSKKTNKRKVD